MGRSEKLPEVEVFAIHALETDSSEGIEPLEWLLLSWWQSERTPRPLNASHDTRAGGPVESWHRMLKSGCQVEAQQFGNLDWFVRATAIFAVD